MERHRYRLGYVPSVGEAWRRTTSWTNRHLVIHICPNVTKWRCGNTHVMGRHGVCPWVFIYEALLYLKHNRDPSVLYYQMQTAFGDKITTVTGMQLGGLGKRSVLHDCSDAQTETAFGQFEKTVVKQLLHKLGLSLLPSLSSAQQTISRLSR